MLYKVVLWSNFNLLELFKIGLSMPFNYLHKAFPLLHILRCLDLFCFDFKLSIFFLVFIPKAIFWILKEYSGLWLRLSHRNRLNKNHLFMMRFIDRARYFSVSTCKHFVNYIVDIIVRIGWGIRII